MILRELIAKIGFNVDSSELDRFDKKITNFKTKLNSVTRAAKIALGAVTAVAGGATALAVSTASAISAQADLSKQLGVTADQLKILNQAAETAGLGSDQITKSLLKFNIEIGRAKNSIKGTTPSLSSLGLSFKDANGDIKDTVTLLSESADKILAIKDPAKQAALTYQLFGTANLEAVRFISSSNDSLKEQLGLIKSITYELDSNSIETSQKFISTWTQVQIVFKSIKDELSINLMPVISEVLVSFRDWFITNKDIIRQDIGKTVAVIATAFKTVSSAIKLAFSPLLFFIEKLGGFSNALSLTAAALAVSFIPNILKAVGAVKALSLALLANPLVAITRAVVALGAAITALIVEDIAYWVAGNDSAIGKILGSWESFKTFVLGIWSDITNGVIESLNTIGNLGQEVFDTVIDGIVNASKKLKDLVTPDFFKKPQTINIKEEVKRRIEEKSITDSSTNKPIEKRTITLLDESNLQEDVLPTISGKTIVVDRAINKINDNIPANNKRKIALLPEPDQNAIDLPYKINPKTIEVNPRDRVSSMVTANPIMPVTNGNITNNTTREYSKPVNNISQNITENITVNVPVGTTNDQARAITEQVADAVNRQFEIMMVRGLDAVNMR